MLIAQDTRSIRGSMGRLLLGMGWCAVAIFAWATVITLLCDALFGSSGIGWRGWFVLGAVVLLGILAWLEFRALSADTLIARSADEDVPAAPPAGEDYAMPVSRGSPLYKLVWGPPAVLSGLRGVRGKHTRRQSAVFDRAAVLVLELAGEPGRVDVKQLVHPPEDLATFAAAVDWLQANDWIGRSTDGGSLWLSTLGQKRLVDAKLTG